MGNQTINEIVTIIYNLKETYDVVFDIVVKDRMVLKLKVIKKV